LNRHRHIGLISLTFHPANAGCFETSDYAKEQKNVTPMVDVDLKAS